MSTTVSDKSKSLSNLENNNKQVPAPKLNEEEMKFRAVIIRDIEKTRDQREQPYPEFDDMTYEEYWTTNAKAANAYIPPKSNEQDVRTTSGTTHEKEQTLLATLLNYDLEPDVEAYDKDDRVVNELGTIMEDMIKKSRKIETPDYEYKRTVIYKELLDQGTVFVEDTQVEFSMPDKEIDRNFDMSDLESVKWTERMAKVYKYCDTNLISGLNVFLGNIREFYIEKQPYIVIRRLITRSEAQSLYGKWERWKNVPYTVEKSVDTGVDSVDFHNWTMKELEDDMVEEVKYMNKWTNNYMLMLNGVPMFPVIRDGKGNLATFPLSALNGECEYPVAKGDIEPISRFFAYSKSIPSKTKVDQAVFDEMLKAIVLKTRKSYQPPMANNTGQALSKKIFYPATIHPNINPEKLQEIGTNDGVTTAEFNAMTFIKEIIDQKSVSPIFEGQAMKGQQTAREIIELKQRSMVKLGVAILGIVNLEKKLSMLRLFNILKYWTEVQDVKMEMTKEGIMDVVNQYKSITVDTTFDEGQQGDRIINFTENIPSDEQVYAEEELRKELTGRETRVNYLDVNRFRGIRYNWYIEIVPGEKNTSSLKIAQFKEMVSDMFGMFIPLGKMPNVEYLATRYAVLNGENPDKIWSQQQNPQQQMMQQQVLMSGVNGGQRQGNRIQSQLTGGMTENKPSLNALMAA